MGKPGGLFCATLLALGVVSMRAQAPAAVSGVVYLDQDGDGARDPDESGIQGVAVSNQHDVVVTAADGRYQLPGPGYGVVFVSVPDAHRAVGRFWRRPAGGATDFPLARTPRLDTFTFVHASDTHVSAESVARLRRVREIVDERRPAFVLVSGDLVKDALRVPEAEAKGYYDLYVGEVEQFTAPVWSVPGNHEIFGIERHRSLVSPTNPLYAKGMYRARLGPDYYSFTAGGIHFIGLDSVDIEDLWYYGHVDATQLAWLEADVARLPPGTPIVTFNHIPFVTALDQVNGFTDEGPAPSVLKVAGKLQYRHSVSNFTAVAEALRGFDWTLALGGHMHTRETIRYASAVTTRFYQTAAVVGPTTGPMPAISGITLYRASQGKVDDGTFLPLDTPGSK